MALRKLLQQCQTDQALWMARLLRFRSLFGFMNGKGKEPLMCTVAHRRMRDLLRLVDCICSSPLEESQQELLHETSLCFAGFVQMAGSFVIDHRRHPLWDDPFVIGTFRYCYLFYSVLGKKCGPFPKIQAEVFHRTISISHWAIVATTRAVRRRDTWITREAVESMFRVVKAYFDHRHELVHTRSVSNFCIFLAFSLVSWAPMVEGSSRLAKAQLPYPVYLRTYEILLTYLQTLLPSQCCLPKPQLRLLMNLVNRTLGVEEPPKCLTVKPLVSRAFLRVLAVTKPFADMHRSVGHVRGMACLVALCLFSKRHSICSRESTGPLLDSWMAHDVLWIVSAIHEIYPLFFKLLNAIFSSVAASPIKALIEKALEVCALTAPPASINAAMSVRRFCSKLGGPVFGVTDGQLIHMCEQHTTRWVELWLVRPLRYLNDKDLACIRSMSDCSPSSAKLTLRLLQPIEEAWVSRCAITRTRIVSHSVLLIQCMVVLQARLHRTILEPLESRSFYGFVVNVGVALVNHLFKLSHLGEAADGVSAAQLSTKLHDATGGARAARWIRCALESALVWLKADRNRASYGRHMANVRRLVRRFHPQRTVSS